MVFLLPLTTRGQQIDSLKTILNSELEINEKWQRAEHFLKDKELSESDSIHFLYYDYARWLRKIDLNEAVHYGEKALEHAYAKKALDTLFIEKGNLSLGYSLQRNSQFKEAIPYYKKVTQINKTPFRTVNSYEQLGYLSNQIQDYHKSIEYYETAIGLLKDDPTKLIQLRNCYLTIYNNFIQLKSKENLQKAEIYVLRADSISAIVPTDDYSLFNIKYSLAQINNQHEYLNIDTSLSYYEQALGLAAKLQDSTRMSLAYYGKGSVLNTTQQEKSIEWYKTGLKYAPVTDSLHRHLLYSGLGTSYAYNKQYKESIDFHYKGLQTLTGKDFKQPLDAYKEYFINSNHQYYLLKGIPRLAESYLKLFEEQQDTLSLEKSISYFEMADYLIDLLKINGTEFNSRLFWRELSTEIYGKAIKACYLSNNYEKAFYFMEKNKALLLIEDLSQQQFKENLHLPNSILEREQLLKKEILQKEVLVKNNSKAEPELLVKLKKSLVDARMQLTNFQDSLTISGGTNKISPFILNLKEVQEQLEEDEVIVEYNISKDDGYGVYSNAENGYGLFMTKNKLVLVEIPNLSRLKLQLNTLLQSMKKPFATQQDIDTYVQASFDVYSQLFPSKEIQELLINKRITLIPDGYLSLLPFEALSTSPTQTTYLIEDCQIRYLYSNSFLKSIRKSEKTNGKFLGMAPVDFDDQDLVSLQNSEAEVLSLDSYFRGTTLLKKEASKKAFLDNLSSFGIIHLATHADAQNTVSPWIAFQDEKITLEELYLAPNNASLVVLSGCNTTLGEAAAGEGVMSLARGFFYSGAQSVVSSLWNIDDAATLSLIDDFYQNLKAGQKKPEALHNAKLNYLDTHNGSDRSPYYWASFILLGADDPLPTSNNFSVFILGIGILLFISFLIAYKKKFRKKSKQQG